MQDKNISSGLDPLRKEIDEIDTAILKLFQRRMEVVKGVGEYKRNNNLPILNEGREQQVINKIVERLENKVIEKETVELFSTLMKVSRDYQDKIIKGENNKEKAMWINMEEADNKEVYKVAYQGMPGSFGEEALDRFFNKDTIKYNTYDFEDVFKMLDAGEIDYGVLPLENSLTGDFAEVYDLLRKYDAHIIGEKVIKVKHNLLSVKGSKLENIKEVYSHPQAFSQSYEYLKNMKWKLTPYYNEDLSAKHIKECNDKSKAAIASKRVADLYELDVLEENINFNSANSTRFIIVGKKLELKESNDKISIVFSTPHQVGELYKVLSSVFNNNLNMVKIESRPIDNKPWEYFFYVDIQGNLLSENVKSAIEKIKKDCSYFHILGNYTADY